MDDRITIVETPRGRFKLEIWETNKAPSWGYVRWSVCASVRFNPEDKTERPHWYRLTGTVQGWTTLDRAEREGDAAMEYWSTHFNPETWDDTPLGSVHRCSECGAEMNVIEDSYLHSAAIVLCPECGYQSYG